MDAISLDQLRVFLQVVKSGSFSAAAREMHRVQSAVTYAVQKLEEQLGAQVFDRSGYRPVLSDAGRALLPRATRVLEEFAALNEQARAIAGGLEPELSIVVDASYSTPELVAALQEFQARFPAVLLRVYVENLGAAAQLVIEGRADFGLTFEFAAESPDLASTPIGEMQLVPLAAPTHPLGRIKGRVTLDAEGRFSANGEFAREGFGPRDEDQAAKGVPALYTGEVKGESMTLTVKLSGTGEEVGTYTLTRGRSARLWKCH